MSDNAMFVDYWEELNTKRIEFRKMMKQIIQEAYQAGQSDGGIILQWAEEYAEKKIKELF